MAEKPILFQTKYVQKIERRQKIETRRIVKYDNMLGEPSNWCHSRDKGEFIASVGDYRKFCPFGMPGDRLWVRETWAQDKSGGYIYKAKTRKDYPWKWKPSIHMPKKATRLWLEIESINMEVLNDITIHGAINEGYRPNDVGILEEDSIVVKFLDDFREIYNVDQNCFTSFDPWVWVIDFKLIGCKNPSFSFAGYNKEKLAMLKKARKNGVTIFLTPENGLDSKNGVWVYAVILNTKSNDWRYYDPKYWIDTFDFQKDAIDFCLKHGIKINNKL